MTDTKMTDTERVEAYLTLSEQLYKQHHDRRSLEWKIHIALWALLVAAGYAIVSNDKHLGAQSLILFLAVPLHFVWCIKIHRGLVREQNLSIRYRKAAEVILAAGTGTPTTGTKPIDDAEERSDMPDRLQRAFDGYWWWLGAEVATTILIASIVVRLAW